MNNTNLIFLGIFLCLVIIGVFLYKRSKKSSVTPISSAVTPTDKVYNEKKLTLKERVELSWKFLYEITELIVNKFSKEDVELIDRLGRILLNNGMRYEHVVNLGIKQTLSKAINVEQSQSQSSKSLSK